jgi:hypothetical protein
MNTVNKTATSYIGQGCPRAKYQNMCKQEQLKEFFYQKRRTEEKNLFNVRS